MALVPINRSPVKKGSTSIPCQCCRSKSPFQSGGSGDRSSKVSSKNEDMTFADDGGAAEGQRVDTSADSWFPQEHSPLTSPGRMHHSSAE
jgi:hypothetical protein